jgi:hypothetical protein
MNLMFIKKRREGKGKFPQVEYPDEIQEELIKGERGASFKWSLQEI